MKKDVKGIMKKRSFGACKVLASLSLATVLSISSISLPNVPGISPKYVQAESANADYVISEMTSDNATDQDFSKYKKTVETLSISIPAGAMVKGDTKKLTVLPKGTKIKAYKSSNKNVIAVSESGKLTAFKSGNATITVVAANGSKANIKIKVFKKNSDMIVNRKIKGKKALWHIKNDKIVKKTGFATDGINWYYAEKGQVIKKTGLFSGKVNGVKAKWYVKKGKVCQDYSGAVTSGNKKWLIKDGKVNEKLTGIFHANGYTYKVDKGIITNSAKGEIDGFIGDEIELTEGKTAYIGSKKLSIFLGSIYNEPANNYSNGICTLNINNVETEVQLINENGKKSVSTSNFIKDYKIEYLRQKGNKYYIKLTKRNGIKKPMSISGKATDRYTTKDFEYIESDNIVVFMTKGVSFDGNLLVEWEKQMKCAEETSGFQRVKNNDWPYAGFTYEMKSRLGTDVFEGVDPEFKKLHIYINDKIYPQCGAYKDSYSNIILNSDYLDVNNPSRFETAFLHEYSHYLHLTQGTSFNVILNEGFAAYNEMKATRKLLSKEQVDDEKFRDDYLFGYLVDRDSITEQNAESIFISGYPDGPTHGNNYNYGCMFMEYLIQTYGENAFRNLFKEGDKMLEKQMETTTFADLSGENTAILLKKTYSDTIFKDFAKWLEANPQWTRDPQTYE